MKKKKGFRAIDSFIIDLRKDKTDKANNEKPIKVDMTLDELVKKFMQTNIKKSN